MKFCRGHELIDASKREQDRLGNVTSLIDQSIHTLTLPDLQHHLFLLTLSGNLYNAPIKDLPGGVHNVLDIGTGTGIWAIDFGKFSFHLLSYVWSSNGDFSYRIFRSQRDWNGLKSHSTRVVS